MASKRVIGTKVKMRNTISTRIMRIVKVLTIITMRMKLVPMITMRLKQNILKKTIGEFKQRFMIGAKIWIK